MVFFRIRGNTCKIYLDEIFKLQKSGRYQITREITTIHVEATPGLCSQNHGLEPVQAPCQNLVFLMYMIHLSSILVYLCIDITQIIELPPIFFFKHVQTQNYPTRNAYD